MFAGTNPLVLREKWRIWSQAVSLYRIQEPGNMSDSQTDGEQMCIVSFVLHVLSNTHNSSVIVENVTCNVGVLLVCE